MGSQSRFKLSALKYFAETWEETLIFLVETRTVSYTRSANNYTGRKQWQFLQSFKNKLHVHEIHVISTTGVEVLRRDTACNQWYMTVYSPPSAKGKMEELNLWNFMECAQTDQFQNLVVNPFHHFSSYQRVNMHFFFFTSLFYGLPRLQNIILFSRGQLICRGSQKPLLHELNIKATMIDNCNHLLIYS